MLKCKTCALRSSFQDGTPACSKFKIKVDPEKDYCSWHKQSQDLIKCRICGQQFNNSDLIIFEINKQHLIVCNNCSQYIGACNSCVHQSECSFKADHSEPQFVRQTVRQGMMTMQQQVKNPYLVEKHCMNCICSYGYQGDCCKDNNCGCKNWQVIPELLQD